MKVLIIADPHIPVPPPGYGGIERNVALMCRGLASRGHRVHLMAGPGSKDYGGGLTLHRKPSLLYYSRAYRKIWFQFIVLRAAMGADVIINHGRSDYLEIIYRTKKPVIHWFHNPVSGREVSYILSRRRQGDHFVGISRSQISDEAQAARFSVVANAVDTEAIPFSPAASTPPYLLFLGRITRNKGVHLAVEAARQARLKLVIGGNFTTEPGSAEYFDAEVRPRLGPECEWVSQFDDEQKSRLLGGATALLFPTQWKEPFGAVIPESLAAGTPVIAWRIAATPEILEHGKTGFLCDSVGDMVAAIHRIKEISRRECRASAEQRFSETVFIRQVEGLIARVVAPQPQGREEPAGIPRQQ
jgi:glycosyltransferase involved in cell wall biosynthesis